MRFAGFSGRIRRAADLAALDDIYTTRAIVAGENERNRPFGFKLCFAKFLSQTFLSKCLVTPPL
jgi:hypothetical protein